MRAWSTRSLVIYTCKKWRIFPTIFFNHFKKLGVSNFAIYNDNSTDKTRDILERESGCTVLQSNYSCAQILKVSNPTIPSNDFLKNSIHTTFFPSSWGIYADSREFMIMPKFVNFLQELIQTLEPERQYQVFAPMVAFWSRKTCVAKLWSNFVTIFGLSISWLRANF